MEEKKLSEDEVWVRIAVAVASSNNTVSKHVAIAWADYIAHEYSKRYRDLF